MSQKEELRELELWREAVGEVMGQNFWNGL